MKNKTQNYLSDMAVTIEPYQWDFGGKNELRFNSNTLPFPPKSLKKFLKEMEEDCPINEYADPNYTKLKKLVAKYESVTGDMITITNSGDEAIDVLAKTFLNPDDQFITLPPTYEVYTIQCEINRGVNLPIPLETPDFQVNVKEVIAQTKNEMTKLLFLCNPNNPSGSVIPKDIIEKIIKESDCIVVVDETYREFYGETITPLIQKYDNLVVLRSFSKFAAMAGARIGYLIANPSLSQKFDGIRFPMGVSYFSYKLAEFVLENDQDWIEQQIIEIKKERTRLKKQLEDFGFTVYPSETNFLLVNMGDKANEIYEKLKTKNIYIRDRSKKKYLAGCVRITIRSKEENDQLIKALEEIL